MESNALIVDPVAQPTREGTTVRPLTSLKGTVVGFIDNSKPNFHHLVDDLADLLVTRHGVADVVRHRKRAASIPAPAEVMADIKARCDFVITGSGD